MRALLNRLKAWLFRWYYRYANRKAWRDHPKPEVATSTLQIPVGERALSARMYHGQAEAPLVIYFHGGGWVIGDLDTHDPFCRALCAASGCTVMSIDYRLAPEHPFPAAHDDCLGASRWILDNLNRLAPNNGRAVLAGDSAGGNLSAATALALTDEPRLVGAIMLYPATEHYQARLPSYIEHARAKPLTMPIMRWFIDTYLGATAPAEPVTERLFMARRAAFHGFPRTLLITAERDPLRDDGKRFALQLRQGGIEVTYEHFPDEAHGFACSEGATAGHEAVVALLCGWLAGCRVSAQRRDSSFAATASHESGR